VNGETLAITRARELATAQCTDGEVAAAMVVEFGMGLSQALEWIAGVSQELVTMRHYGRTFVRERTYHLATMSPDDCKKANSNTLAAMATFGAAYLNLDEHQKLAKLVEKAERKVAAGSKPGLKAVGS
jgi:hypothetical protein